MEVFFSIIAVLLVLAMLGGMIIFGAGMFGITRLVQWIAGMLQGNRRKARRMQGSTRVPPAMNQGPRPTGQQGAGPVGRQGTRPVNQPTTPPSPRSYEYFDVDAGATPEDISKTMGSYVGTRVIGYYAREVMETLNMADLRKKAVFSEIDAKFSPKSISWDHFAGTTQEALDAILRNCALLANRVQSFDVSDYERMEMFYRTGGEMRNGAQDPARIKRWELLRSTKDEMDKIISSNEALLLELDKLASALAKISSNESTGESSRIAEEVSRLAEETKYYN